MRNKGWNAGYYVREGFFSIFKHGLMSFAAVCMIVACLLIMGTFSLVAVNLDENLRELEAENEFLAYVDESLSEEAARGLETAVSAVANVRTVEFVSREQVLEEFRTSHTDTIFQELPEDTFRHRYLIRVVDIEDMAGTVARVENLTGIADTSAGIEIAQGMVAVRNAATLVAVVLITILAVVSLFIISNTIRLATFYRREEIAIMKMCGATNGFVRWPFVVEGALLGLFGALMAFFLQWGVYHLVTASLSSGNTLGFLVLLPFAALWGRVLLSFLAAGLVIGVLGSLLAIRRFLRV